MTWGELWDQRENLAAHTMKGIEFLDRYNEFVKDRCQVETEYASKLRNLVKKYLPPKKKTNAKDKLFTYEAAFNGIVGLLNDVAIQHEQTAEMLKVEVQTEAVKAAKQLREQRKTLLQETEKLDENLARQKQSLEKTFRDYEKSHKDAEAARIKYERADADLQLSRAAVEKTRLFAESKLNFANEAKADYAQKLQNTNSLQAQHNSQLLPTVLERLRQMDESRIDCIRQLMIHCIEIDRRAIPILNDCLNAMNESAQSINGKSDSMSIAESLRSGKVPPGNLEFFDLSLTQNASPKGLSSSQQSITATTFSNPGSPSDKKKGTVSKGTKAVTESATGCQIAIMTADQLVNSSAPLMLPQNQPQSVTDLRQELSRLESARSAMEKLMNTYETTVQKGNPGDVAAALAENSSQIRRIQTELQRYEQNYQADSSKPANLDEPKTVQYLQPFNSGEKTPNSTQSLDDRDLAGGADVSAQVVLRAHNNSYSFSSDNTFSNVPDIVEFKNSSDPAADTVRLEPVGQTSDDEPTDFAQTVKVLYDFAGVDEASLPVSAGELVRLISKDEVTGWTHVQRLHNDEQGFIPTSYFENT